MITNSFAPLNHNSNIKMFSSLDSE